MSLPTQVVDRLFARMAATYGAAWDRSMGLAPIGDVKTAWAHELQGFAKQLDAVAWALENLPERCPNVIEFRNLCRKAPAPETPRLPEPPADPERLRAELAKLAPLLKAPIVRSNTDWASRIVAKADSGMKVSPLSLSLARAVLERKGVAA